MDRLVRVIAAIDEANTADPHTIEVGGQVRPKELAHAQMMTRWIERLDPDCSEEQRIAARAHHLRRWSVPRSSYPDGRSGYLRWRTALQRQHAAEVGEIMRRCGYDDGAVERVQAIIRKHGLGHDPAVQVHEDALCLVFLETQLDDVASRLGDDASVEVLRKTVRKMSPAAVEAARELPLSPSAADLLDRALAASAAGSD